MACAKSNVAVLGTVIPQLDVIKLEVVVTSSMMPSQLSSLALLEISTAFGFTYIFASSQSVPIFPKVYPEGIFAP